MIARAEQAQRERSQSAKAKPMSPEQAHHISFKSINNNNLSMSRDQVLSNRGGGATCEKTPDFTRKPQHSKNALMQSNEVIVYSDQDDEQTVLKLMHKQVLAEPLANREGEYLKQIASLEDKLRELQGANAVT